MSENQFSDSTLEPVEEALSAALIQVCYGFDATPYIKVLDEAAENSLSEQSQNVLDPILSCLSIGMAIRLLRSRYGEKSQAIVQEITDRIYQSVMETDTNESAAGYITELIDYYSRLTFSSGSPDLCEKIVEPVGEMLEDFELNDEMCRYLQAFLLDFARQAKNVIEKAEEEYDYSP